MHMSLSTGGGLTYQYYDGTPLWPFGFGLSYTTFALHWHSASHQITTRQALEYASFAVTVTNTGSVTSDVTVLAFLSATQTGCKGQPQRELFAFCRLNAVMPLQSASCDLAVAASVVAHNATVSEGAYAVVVELGDGVNIQGGLRVTG